MKSKYQLELADLYIRQKKYIESEKLLSQLIKKYYKNPNIFYYQSFIRQGNLMMLKIWQSL